MSRIIRIIAKFKYQISVNLFGNDDILGQKGVKTYENVNDSLTTTKKILDDLNIGFKSFQPLIDPIQFLNTNNKINLPSNIVDIDPFSEVLNFINLSTEEEKRRIEISKYLKLDKTIVLEFDGKKSILEITKALKKENKIIESIEIDYLSQQVSYIKKQEINQIVKEEIDLTKKLFNLINYNPYLLKKPKNEIIIAVIDSGINYNHNYFKDNLWCKTLNTKQYYGINLTSLNNGDCLNVSDENSHGTHVAGIISSNSLDNKTKLQGIAKNCKLLTIKSNNEGGNIHISRQINALAIAYVLGANVFNCSWNLYVRDKISNEIFNKESEKFKELLSFFELKKCIPVFAADNISKNVEKIFPQNQKNVIVVGAIDKNKKRASYSCFGSNVTVWAPGNNIPTLSSKDNYKTTLDTGTSMSAPIVSAAIALLKQQNNDLNITQIKEKLQVENKIDISNTGDINKKKSFLGHMLNINKTLNLKIMPNCQLPSLPYKLETPTDISEHIFVYVHVDNPNIYQLLHTEVKELDTKFHIYGKFKGVLNGDCFELKTIELKIVSMNYDSNSQHVITGARFVLDQNNKCMINFYIDTKIAKGQSNSFSDVKGLEKPFKLYKNQIIDNHINHSATRNGRICVNAVYFEGK